VSGQLEEAQRELFALREELSKYEGMVSGLERQQEYELEREEMKAELDLM
jgi:hypothetical protein